MSAPVSRPALSRDFIALHKRNRIMKALAELVAEQGYEATKISDLVRHAAVARKTLYDNFAGKEEVFLGAFDATVAEMRARVEEACASAEGDWQAGVEAGLAALLDYVDEEPAMARLVVIEAISATPAATSRRDEALEAFVELARETLPQDARLPSTIEESLVGGVAWILHRQLRQEEALHAIDLLPQLSEFMLAPYLGLGLAKGGRKRG
jgi:AcrR family transcriptional regulator